MKILTVIYEFPPIGGGGGRVAYDICKGLAARGHAVTVLTSHISGLPYVEDKDGIHVVRVPSLRREHFVAPFKTMLAYVLSGLWMGLRLILKDRPDVMHTHFAVPSGALAWALSVLTGVPYVLTAHLGDVPGGVPEKTDKWFRWVKPFTHLIWKRAKKIAAVSEHTRRLALQNYAVDIEVIPNGADIEKIAPREIKLNAPLRLVFAGRFAPQKNTPTIIAVLARLKDLDWTCSMLGDGEYLDEVKRGIESHGMTARFELPGWVTPDDVLEKFSHSDILFMPSFSEGLPVVGVQALAKGLALVVSDIGGFLDLVDHGKNGFLIDVHDHDTFESALRDLLSHPDRLIEFRKASLQKSKGFDIASIEARYAAIFREIVS
jgi:glycosyltransferase involved in cell wall biosynthesis